MVTNTVQGWKITKDEKYALNFLDLLGSLPLPLHGYHLSVLPNVLCLLPIGEAELPLPLGSIGGGPELESGKFATVLSKANVQPTPS